MEGKQGINVADVMNTWIRQTGHPVIDVRKINSNSISVSQRHFLMDPTKTNTSK